MKLRDNNFDLLRLVFAGSVFLSHLYVLSLAPALGVLSLGLFADIAVKGFFIISGYLVMMSYGNSSSVREYGEKRLRRIYPAYAAVVLACAIAGVLFTSLPLAEYASADLARYLAANVLFLNFLAPALPGVFEAQPNGEVNGALWTLKIEVMYYLFVPALAWMMGRLGRWRVIVALYVLSVLYTIATGLSYSYTGVELWLQLQRQLPGQLSYFLVGVALHYLNDRLKGRRWAALAAAALLLFVTMTVTVSPLLTFLLEPLALGILVIFAATALPYLGNFARYGDFSYGIYIIHFPVVQLLVAGGAFGANPWAAAAAALVLVVGLSALSWYAVERPFLRPRSHYRAAQSRGAGGT